MNSKLIYDSVKQFYFINDDIYAWQKNELEINSKKIFKGDIVHTYIFGNCILVQNDYYGKKCLINTITSEIKYFNSSEDGIQLMISESKFLRTTYSGDYSKTFLSVYEISSHCEEWQFEFPGLRFVIMDDSKLFVCNECEVISCDIENGKFSWRYHFAQIERWRNDEGNYCDNKIVSIIGVFSNLLWLHVTDRRLIALDITTGTLEHEILLYQALGLPQHEPATDSLIYGDMHLDTTNGIIKSLSWRYYWELDVKKLTASIKKDFGKDYNNTWRITKSKYYQGDNNLYFIGTQCGETFNREVGIFDTDNCEVVWYDEPLSNEPQLFFVDAPQCNGNELGILDTGGTLRIYDKK